MDEHDEHDKKLIAHMNKLQAETIEILSKKFGDDTFKTMRLEYIQLAAMFKKAMEGMEGLNKELVELKEENLKLRRQLENK
jgi:hypothetical protein